MAVHSPQQLKDTARHAGENAQPEVSALSSTQILVRMLRLSCCSAICTADTYSRTQCNKIQKKLPPNKEQDIKDVNNMQGSKKITTLCPDATAIISPLA